MPTRLLLAIAGALILLRVPSLTQPMGPDQGLYAYVGERILAHDLAYRDAWDQKPPGIHYVYAALRAISRRDVMVPAADLAAAVLVAAMVWAIGARLGGPVAGGLAAVFFLLLSDPSMDRYGGMRVRAQAETFIALAVAGAVALALGAEGATGAGGAEGAGAKGAGGAEGAGAKGAGGAEGAGAKGAGGAEGAGAKGAGGAEGAGAKGAGGAEGAGAKGAGGAESAKGAGGAEGAKGAGGAESALRVVGAGVLIGAAFTLKYNAGVYALVVLVAMGLMRGLRVRDVVVVAAGAAIVPLLTLAVFWRGGALDDLYQATVAYNLRYSQETYASRLDMAKYLVTFPIRHARTNPLWFVGGLGCLTLLVAGVRRRTLWMPIAWVAIACVSIAINGSRELPQYFVQATPALALAGGIGAAVALGRAPVAVRWIAALIVAYGCWRVGSEPFPKKLAANAWSDAQYLIGRVDRRTHLARFGGARSVDKYSALDNVDIGWFLAQQTAPADTVYVFGFSPASYVYASRRSASRFFWSRPVILDFNHENPAYGVAGLRRDLERNRPAYVVLQQHDWAPDVQDSAPFFLSQPALSEWLQSNYHEVHPFVDGFSAWERNGR